MMIEDDYAADTITDLERLKRLDRILTATSSEGRQRLATYLRRYMSPLLIEDLFEQEQLGVLTKEDVVKPVTVIVADVRGFTPQTLLAERSGRGMRTVAELLERFMNDATETVFEYRGVMGEFLGDKFAAFFGIPFAQQDDANRAILAAIDIYHSAMALNRSLRLSRRHHMEFDIGIGMCTGGPLWIGDIGAGWRRELSMIGTVIHAASRIEELTKDAEFSQVQGLNILLTQSCLDALGPQIKEYLALETFPPRTLRGLGEDKYQLYKIVNIDRSKRNQVPLVRSHIDSATLANVDTIAQLVESIQEREDRGLLQQTIQDIGQAIISSLELDEVLESVLDEVQRFLNATTASLLLVEEGTQRLRFRAVRPKKFIGDLRSVEEKLVIGKGIVGHVAQEGVPLLLYDAQQDPRFYSQADKKTGFQTRSVLCCPIKIADTVVGVIQVIDDQPGKFFDEDLRTLGSIAAFAASAIRNARQYDRVAEAETLAAMGVVTSDIAHRLKNDVGLIKLTAGSVRKRFDKTAESVDQIEDLASQTGLEVPQLRELLESTLDSALAKLDPQALPEEVKANISSAGLSTGLRQLVHLGAKAVEDRQYYHRSLDRIYQSTETTLQLMDEIRHPFTEISLEQAQLRDLIESALDSALAKADPEAPIEIKRSYIPLPDLVTDTKRLVHVFYKVIENAIQAMASSEQRILSIDVWQPDPNRVRVGIADTGPGIPASSRDQLFHPGRMSVVDQSKPKGWGYGLWSSRLFIRSIGGAISLDDVQSEGTRFILDLPLVAQMPLSSEVAAPEA